MSMAETLPLFPLHTVLFPGGPLSLRIFETRYVDMIGRCMRDGSSFGVVLIREGPEVGAIAAVADVGSSARIVDFCTLPGGLLGIACVGERKFRLVKRWTQGDGLNLGEVEYLPPEPECAVPEEYRPFAQLVRSILPGLGQLYASLSPRFEDAGWVGCRLAEVLPLALPERLALLELSDPLARLARIASLLPTRQD
jgi:Lon protease-like protein